MRMCSCTGSIGQRPDKTTPESHGVKHVDAARFLQLAGDNPALMVRIAKAFLSQLPPWRAEFAAATAATSTASAASHQNRLPALLHKMKGSCHAISAAGAADAFGAAELAMLRPDDVVQTQTQPIQTMLQMQHLQHLLVLVSELEFELELLIHQSSSQAPFAPST